ISSVTPDMQGPEQLKPKDLVVGGRYLHVNRLFIRQIDAVEGDTVVVSKPTSNVVAGQALRRPDGRGVIRERVDAGISAATTMPHEFMHPIYRLLSPRWRNLAQQVAASWLVAGLLATQN